MVKRTGLCSPSRRLSWRFVIFPIYRLLFDGPPQTLDTDVVQRPTTPSHAHPSTRCLQATGKIGARALRPWVTMKPLRCRPPPRLLEGIETTGGSQSHGHRP